MVKRGDGGLTDPNYWINEATLAALSGFVVCAFFLSLQKFEIFWYLCVIVNALVFLSESENGTSIGPGSGQIG